MIFDITFFSKNKKLKPLKCKLYISNNRNISNEYIKDLAIKKVCKENKITIKQMIELKYLQCIIKESK